MEPRVLKNESAYEEALEALADLLAGEPAAGSDAATRAELLALLIKDYEARMHPVDLPDAVEAIQFRMEQQNLTARDLVPHLGSRSRVSEILARKRPLTLPMIRALNRDLGIPASVLLRDPETSDELTSIEWLKMPFAEMKRRGWIGRVPKTSHEAENCARAWLAPLEPLHAFAALYKRTVHIRSARSVDRHALAAWTAQVVKTAIDQPPRGGFDRSCITDDFLREVTHISVFDRGPKLAQEFLGKYGIALVVEPQLSKTYLDGAAILYKGLMPVIGITVRNDRLDSFWFCLMHELAHLARHLTVEETMFYDDLDSDGAKDRREAEADQLAGEVLVPFEMWRISPASRLRTAEAAVHLANRLHIHPAVVAGRIRFQSRDYRVLSGLVGLGEVRKCFPEVSWV